MEKIKNNLIITASIAILLIASIWYFVNNNAVVDNSAPINETSELYDPNPQPTTPQEEIVTVLINYGEQGTFDYQTKHEEAQTALSLLLEASDENNVEVETTEYDFGIMVDSIDGMESGSDKAWIYFVNGESAKVGADAYEVQGGDTIEWRYVEPAE